MRQGKLEYTWDNTKKHIKNFKEISSKIIKSINLSNKYTPEQLQKECFYDYIVKVLDKQTANEILNQFGYSSEITHMNAYDAIHLMKDHLVSDKEFYALRGGLTQVVDRLEKEIKEMGGKIIRNRNVERLDYNKESEKFHIKCDGISKDYKSNECVCAVTASVLLKMPIFQASRHCKGCL